MKTLMLPTNRTLSAQPFRTPNFESLAVSSAIKGIIFPEPGRVRSRKVVSRSNARSTGKHPSWKMGRMIHWESSHELNAFRLLDCDPNVLSFSEQPCEIVYVMNGVKMIHYPDILVVTAEQKEFWEVKPRSKALEPAVLARTAYLSGALSAWGYGYRAMLGEDLAGQPRLKNANLLLRFGYRAFTVCEWEHVRRAISCKGSLVWSEACDGDYGAKGRQILCSLVLRGELTVDISYPISPATQFFAKKGGL